MLPPFLLAIVGFPVLLGPLGSAGRLRFCWFCSTIRSRDLRLFDSCGADSDRSFPQKVANTWTDRFAGIGRTTLRIVNRSMTFFKSFRLVNSRSCPASIVMKLAGLVTVFWPGSARQACPTEALMWHLCVEKLFDGRNDGSRFQAMSSRTRSGFDWPGLERSIQ
jgi:hypothetical protein